MARAQEQDALQINLIALKSVYYSVKSLLGPNKMLKCCARDTSDEVEVFNDTMKLLECLSINNAAFSLLYDMLLSHHAIFGCGCTSMVVLCALLGEECHRLRKEGLPIPLIISGYQDAIEICSSVARRHSMSLSTLHQKFVKLQPKVQVSNQKLHSQFSLSHMGVSQELRMTGSEIPENFNFQDNSPKLGFDVNLPTWKHRQLPNDSSTLSSCTVKTEMDKNSQSKLLTKQLQTDKAPSQQASFFPPSSGVPKGRLFSKAAYYSRHLSSVEQNEKGAVEVKFTLRDKELDKVVSQGRSNHESFKRIEFSQVHSLSAKRIEQEESQRIERNHKKPHQEKKERKGCVLGEAVNSGETLEQGTETTIAGPAFCPHSEFIQYFTAVLCSSLDATVCKMAALCMANQCSAELGPPNADHLSQDLVFTEKCTGPGKGESHVSSNAVVLRIRPDFVSAVKRFQAAKSRPLRVLVVTGDISPGYVHRGMKRCSNVTQVVQAPTITGSHSEEPQSWLYNVIESLTSLRVDVLVTKGNVSRDVVVTCLSHDLVILDNVEVKKLAVIASLSKSEMLTYLYQAQEHSVGTVCGIAMVTVSSWKIPKVKMAADMKGSVSLSQKVSYCKILLPKSSRVSSVVICSPSQCQTQMLESEFVKCLRKLQEALVSGSRFVRGGGAFERACLEALSSCASCNGQRGRKDREQSMEMRSNKDGSVFEDDLMRNEVLLSFGSVLEAFLTVLKLNTPEEVESLCASSPDLSEGTLPRLLDMSHFKLLLWRKTVDYVRLLHIFSL